MKTFLLLSIGGAVIVGGVAVFMLMKSDTNTVKTDEAMATSTETAVDTTLPISGTGSMSSLLARAENLECSVSYTAPENNITTEGTFFTSRERLRGDFIVSGTPTETLSSVILKENTLYSWTEIEGEKYGMKISLELLQESKSNESAPDAREAVPLDAAVAYTCVPWDVIDGSIFEPPADVLFKDYVDLMNVGMEFGTVYEGESSVTDTQTQCALCDKVVGDGKAECKKAFSCQ